MTAIISREFCTMFHAYFFYSNKFHKFWMSCACRRSQSKDGRKRRKSRPPRLTHAGRPDTSTYRGTSFLQEQRGMLTMLLSEENIPDSGGPGRHEDQATDPQDSAQIIKWGSYPTQGHCGALICNVGEAEGQWAPEAGRPSSPGPASLAHARVKDKQPSNRHQEQIRDVQKKAVATL